MKPWFLLYDGSSPDGRGEATYIGRTEDGDVAWTHFLKCLDDPYSTGFVMFIDDKECRHAGSWLKKYTTQGKPADEVKS